MEGSGAGQQATWGYGDDQSHPAFGGHQDSKDRNQGKAGANANRKPLSGQVGLPAAIKGLQNPVPASLSKNSLADSGRPRVYFPALIQQGTSSRLEATAESLDGC